MLVEALLHSLRLLLLFFFPDTRLLFSFDTAAEQGYEIMWCLQLLYLEIEAVRYRASASGGRRVKILLKCWAETQEMLLLPWDPFFFFLTAPDPRVWEGAGRVQMHGHARVIWMTLMSYKRLVYMQIPVQGGIWMGADDEVGQWFGGWSSVPPLLPPAWGWEGEGALHLGQCCGAAPRPPLPLAQDFHGSFSSLSKFS